MSVDEIVRVDYPDEVKTQVREFLDEYLRFTSFSRRVETALDQGAIDAYLLLDALKHEDFDGDGSGRAIMLNAFRNESGQELSDQKILEIAKDSLRQQGIVPQRRAAWKNSMAAVAQTWVAQQGFTLSVNQGEAILRDQAGNAVYSSDPNGVASRYGGTAIQPGEARGLITQHNFPA